MIIKYMHGLGFRTFQATKRMGDLVFIGMNTALYHEKRWENLFFFRKGCHEKSKLIIAECMLSNEEELVKKFNIKNIELEAKEKIIQQLLLLERQELTTQSTSLNQGWVALFFWHESE